MAIARNCNNDRVSDGALTSDGATSSTGGGGAGAGNFTSSVGSVISSATGRLPSETAKQNYTAIKYGNDHGSISFGSIHKQGDVTSGVMLQTSDANHSFFMDKDGPRKGWTTITSPGNVQIEAGSDNEELKIP